MPEIDSKFETRFVEVDEVDPFAEDLFVIGELGSMSERLGLEQAKVAEQQSLTYYTRLQVARRLGSATLR